MARDVSNTSSNEASKGSIFLRGASALTNSFSLAHGNSQGGRIMKRLAEILTASLSGGVLLFSNTALADESGCAGLPTQSELQAALTAATATETSGLNNQMWATIVDRDGIVCAVAFSGVNRSAQWPGSRVISAQKANTGNAFSLDSSSSSNGSGQPKGLALSTANLYSAVNPGGSLYGLQHSNPVNPEVAYAGNPGSYGKANDPMVGERIGGVNVFGGGLALYAVGKVVVGGLGVSGDTSCADHNIAWRVRHNLGLDHLLGVAGGFWGPQPPDHNGFDILSQPNGGTGNSARGVRPPRCLQKQDQSPPSPGATPGV